MESNDLIIIGGGASVKKGIKKDLWNKLEGKFTFGLNYSFKFFKSTVQLFCDEKFYNKQRHELTKLPLIIGMSHKMEIMPNTITLSTATRYFRNLSGGVYSPDLTGLFALTLGIYLLDVGNIYLLGYDFGEIRKKDLPDIGTSRKDFLENTELDEKKRYVTHWYQGKCEHRGVGKVSYFHRKKRPRAKFKPYMQEKKCKIYNVNPTSRIPDDIFEKINYDEFFSKIDTKKYDQIELRKEIRRKLNC